MPNNTKDIKDFDRSDDSVDKGLSIFMFSWQQQRFQ
jgi:hypothetical protein